MTTVTDQGPAALPGRMIAAWAGNDADAFAALFAEDGLMSLPGDTFLKGRAAVLAFMTAAYAGPYRGTSVTGRPLHVQPIADGVVLVVTEGGVLAAGETELAPERAIRAFWLLKNVGGEWLIAAYQNTPQQP